MEIIFFFILIAGYIFGLGAVTVIDILGFLGRKSSYWTETTIRTHKVTKRLIWIGILFVCLGSYTYFSLVDIDPFQNSYTIAYFLLLLALIINGIFLSFVVSPYLLKKEAQGKSTELLSSSWQKSITVSFLVSCTGWWGSLILLLYILHYA